MTNTEGARKATLAEVMGTLDELAHAARAGDLTRYRGALTIARQQGITGEQIEDSHRWATLAGPRPNTAVTFDWHGNPK